MRGGPQRGVVMTRLTYLVLINVVTFLVYDFDKFASQRGWRRVPEVWLHLLALAGGSPAAYLAQRVLRHKLRTPRFMAIFWLIVGLQALVLFLMLVATILP